MHVHDVYTTCMYIVHDVSATCMYMNTHVNYMYMNTHVNYMYMNTHVHVQEQSMEENDSLCLRLVLDDLTCSNILPQ